MAAITKKDLRIEWFSGSGSGGQHRNRHKNCCRLTHIETGVTTQGTDHKERRANQRDAIRRMANHWRIKAFLSERLEEEERGETIRQRAERAVDELMKPENIRDDSPSDFAFVTRGKKPEIIDGVEIYYAHKNAQLLLA